MPTAHSDKKIPEDPQISSELPPSPSTPRTFLIHPKLKWFGLGLIFLILFYLVVEYIQKDVLRPPVLFGSVLHENSEPFDGATVSVNGKFSVTRPDGKFQIEAKKTDTLTVSAFGYSTTTILGEEIVATLIQLPTANVRVLVVDPEYKEVEKALVVRLDPNTSAPVDERVTDEKGIATFSDILSGQAAFVVLHPDYGMAWIETAVESEGSTRPVVQLTTLQGNEISQNSMVKAVYAQEKNPSRAPSDGYEERDEIIYQIDDAAKIADGKFEVSLRSRTMVAVSFSRQTLENYINRRLQLEQQYQSRGEGDYTIVEVDRIRQALIKEGYISPVTAIRIVPKFTDTSFEIDPAVQYGFDSQTGAPKYIAASVDEIRQNQYEIKILGMDNASEVMGFIERMHAQTPDGQKSSISGWSQFPNTKDFIQQNGGKIKMEFDFSNNCCTVTNVEISSQNTQPNPISVKDLHNKQTSYTFRPSIADKYRAGYLGLEREKTEFEKFMQSNPKLQITNPSGQKVSLLDIETPQPDDAPPGFLGGFFEDGNEARKMFNNGDPNYVKKWQDFLGMQLYNEIRKAETSSTDIRNEIIRKLGLPPRYFEPLGFPSGQGRDYRTGSTTSGNGGNSSNDTSTQNGSGGSSTGNEQTGNGTNPSGGQTTGPGVNPGCPEGATYTCSR